ncbi:arylamine N-acetyltransferase family protein [Streptomyces jeddahensis]|uniref:Arylamine N-acetyltransferase n=1 Tax=Streptomyces jeddahensis TaxID=1716141 RepID=A0A177HWF2_9ACTN|nr:arylamine N-acetyltransferase [Streptomyces jeddahensis]OAH15010.1 arylamine N-acetyltransferase [Streptomyces jeddahensis]
MSHTTAPATSPASSPSSRSTVDVFSESPRLDLDAYLARIGWSGQGEASVEMLRSVHRAHVHGIPFENVEPVLGSAPSLALADLQAKLVRSRRGGYCFEHNTLFAAVLEALGFGVTRLAARVRVGAQGAVRPRTHMLLLVDVPGASRQYLADVGFGSIGGLLEAIPLTAGTEVHDGGRRHRLVREPHHGLEDLWVLQAFQGGAWSDQYAFSREPFEPADYEVINWHVATNPRSPFQHTLYAQRTTPDTHLALAGRALVIMRADGTREERELADSAELRQVLDTDFGIELPEGARLEAGH